EAQARAQAVVELAGNTLAGRVSQQEPGSDPGKFEIGEAQPLGDHRRQHRDHHPVDEVDGGRQEDQRDHPPAQTVDEARGHWNAGKQSAGNSGGANSSARIVPREAPISGWKAILAMTSRSASSPGATSSSCSPSAVRRNTATSVT